MSPLAKSAGLPACRQAGKTCFVFRLWRNGKNWIQNICFVAGFARQTERSGGQKGRGLGGMNFCPPSLSDSNFSVAAEFRISLCEMRHRKI